jgi:hypothetical protein
MTRQYTNEEIETQRRQMEEVRRFGGRTDFDDEYALYRFMIDGVIPKRNDYGHEIDQKLATQYVNEEA